MCSKRLQCWEWVLGVYWELVGEVLGGKNEINEEVTCFGATKVNG